MFQFISVHFDIARAFCFTFRPPPPARNTATPGRSAAQNTQPPSKLVNPRTRNKAPLPSVPLRQPPPPAPWPFSPAAQIYPGRHLTSVICPGTKCPRERSHLAAPPDQVPGRALRIWNKPQPTRSSGLTPSPQESGTNPRAPTSDRSPAPPSWTPDPLTEGVNSFTIDPVSWKCVLQSGLGVRSILARTNDAGQMSAHSLLALFFHNSYVSALARCGMALGPKPLADVCALQATLQSRIERSE